MFKEPKLQITDLESHWLYLQENLELRLLFFFFSCIRKQMYCDSFATSRYYVTFGVLCSLCVRATAVATGQIKIIVIITHFQWHFLVLGIQCVLFLYVRFLKRNCSQKSGCQEEFRNMWDWCKHLQLIKAGIEAEEVIIQSSEPKEHSVYPH